MRLEAYIAEQQLHRLLVAFRAELHLQQDMAYSRQESPSSSKAAADNADGANTRRPAACHRLSAEPAAVA